MKIVDYDNLITDRSKEKWFFGEYSGFQRYDFIPDAFIKKLNDLQRNQFWFPNEIALHEDRKTFPLLPEHNQEHIKLNLTFQTLMDSSQERSLGFALLPHITSPTLEMCIKTQEYFELIHSESYSHIIREMFDNPTELFDKYAVYPEIKHRTKEEIDCYREFMIKGADSSDENKLLLLKLCFRIQLLEGVKFMISFATTLFVNKYAGNGNLIPNVGRTIKMILNDELIHCMIFSYIIQKLRKDEKQGFTHLFTPETEEMFKENALKVYEDELGWYKFLASFGEIPGFSEENAKLFLQYYTDDRLRKCGCKPIFNVKGRPDIIAEFNDISNINDTNASLQEVTNISYNKASMKYDTNRGRVIEDLEREIDNL